MLSDFVHPAISDIDELLSVHGAIWVVFIGQYKYIIQHHGLDKVEIFNSLLLPKRKVAGNIHKQPKVNRTKGRVIICKQKVEQTISAMLGRPLEKYWSDLAHGRFFFCVVLT